MIYFSVDADKTFLYFPDRLTKTEDIQIYLKVFSNNIIKWIQLYNRAELQLKQNKTYIWRFPSTILMYISKTSKSKHPQLQSLGNNITN